jgi:chromosome segregation ATPase
MIPFEIDSPFLQVKNKENWNRYQVVPQDQAVDSSLVDVVANEMHKKEMENLNKKLSRSKEQIQELKNTNSKVWSKVTVLEKELEQKVLFNNHLREEIERLSGEIEKLKPPTISGI